MSTIIDTLITDRTAADVARVHELAVKGYAGMTAAELAEWLAGMKRRHPALNIAVSDFSIHLHTVWMFTLFEEIIMHRVKPREMKQVIAEYIRFETTGWKELMKI